MKEKYLKLAVERAIDAYKNGTEQEKNLLILLYGKEEFLIDVKDRVTDYESACVELGIKPLTIHSFTFLPEEDQEKAFARHQLVTVRRALTGTWKPDFTDGTWKYYTYVYWDSSKNGFSSDCCSFIDSCFVGSDLLFPNEELAEYARKIMEKEYLTYLI